MVLPPEHCPNGHRLGPNRTLVGNQPCDCGRDMYWACRTCDAGIYAPELTESCGLLHGPAAVKPRTGRATFV